MVDFLDSPDEDLTDNAVQGHWYHDGGCLFSIAALTGATIIGTYTGYEKVPESQYLGAFIGAVLGSILGICVSALYNLNDNLNNNPEHMQNKKQEIEASISVLEQKVKEQDISIN